MGRVRPVHPVKLVCGLLFSTSISGPSVHHALEDLFGPIDGATEPAPFSFSDYYSEEMGEGLARSFVSFQRLIDPAALPGVKHRTNGLEHRFATGGEAVRASRQVNIDPGYLTPAKLILATTKDYAHRVYLGDGIYGDLTLLFRKGETVPLEWTYPDYRTTECVAFMRDARDRLLAVLQSGEPPGGSASAKEGGGAG